MNHFFGGEVFLPKHLCRILCVTSFIEVEYDKLLYLKPTLAHFRFYPISFTVHRDISKKEKAKLRFGEKRK